MDQLLQQMVNGVSLGSIYALIALGYTMVYGIIKLINFAHGDVYMVGAYIGFAATTFTNLSFLPALIISMVASAILGMFIEKVAYKPLRNSSKIAALITAIGVSLLLENLMTYFAGAEIRSFPKLLSDEQINLGNIVLNMQQVYIVITAVADDIAPIYCS